MIVFVKKITSGLSYKRFTIIKLNAGVVLTRKMATQIMTYPSRALRLRIIIYPLQKSKTSFQIAKQLWKPRACNYYQHIPSKNVTRQDVIWVDVTQPIVIYPMQPRQIIWLKMSLLIETVIANFPHFLYSCLNHFPT